MDTNICAYISYSIFPSACTRQRYALIHLPESNTQNVEIFFRTSKQMGSNRKNIPLDSCNGYLRKNVWELVVFLDFEYGIPLMDDGQCGLHQKIEQKTPTSPTIWMSQIQKISKHKIIIFNHIVIKYNFFDIISYIWKQILQNIFYFWCHMTIFM